MKKCKKCGGEKELSEYSKDKGRVSGIRDVCRLCIKVYNKNSRDKEANRGYARMYRIEHKEKCVEAQRKWKEGNPDYYRDWKRDNSGKTNSYTAKRRADKLLATPAWANQKYIDIWYVLAKSEEARTGRKVHVDHIVPLQGELVCGLHCESNMQLLFAEDNIRKSNTFVV